MAKKPATRKPATKKPAAKKPAAKKPAAKKPAAKKPAAKKPAAKKPAPSRDLEVEEMEPLDSDLLQEFVGEAAAESLESALEGLENGAPLFVWPGDLRIEGDITSEELLRRCAGFEAPAGPTALDRAFTVFIQGNLEVKGVLKVAQYHDVFVQRDVQARSILSHTGNLVVNGQISATEIVAFECNEEGGFLHGASCAAPLLCRFGYGGWEWAVSNQIGKTEIWEIPGDAEFIGLSAALTHLNVEPTWRGVSEVVASSRTGELLRALGRAPASPP